MNASGTWFDINGNIPYSAKMFYVVEWDSVFPAITIQPMGQTIGPGQTATLSVALWNVLAYNILRWITLAGAPA